MTETLQFSVQISMSVRMKSCHVTISATTPLEATLALVSMDSVSISQTAGLAMISMSVRKAVMVVMRIPTVPIPKEATTVPALPATLVMGEYAQISMNATWIETCVTVRRWLNAATLRAAIPAAVGPGSLETASTVPMSMSAGIAMATVPRSATMYLVATTAAVSLGSFSLMTASTAMIPMNVRME
jgi:hypothetical protein